MWAAIESIAPKNGCIPQTMHEWARKQEIDIGTRDGITSEQGNRIKALEREVNHHRLLKPIGYIPLPKPKKITIGNSPVKPPQRNDLNQPAFLKPGAFHFQ